MNADKIKYISAGAGSGKTYSITHKLADLIKEGEVKPEEVILTTFTKKAANDLLEKARQVLIEEKQFDAAIQLDRALIGTIDSVAYSFMEKYWYLLGLNAKQSVMPDEDVKFYVNQSIAEIVQDEDSINFFRHFRDYFDIQTNDKKESRFSKPDYDFWKRYLTTIIDYALKNHITDFTDSIAISIDTLKKIIKPIDKPLQINNTECIECVNKVIEIFNNQRASDANNKRTEKFKRLLAINNWTFPQVISLCNEIGNIKLKAVSEACDGFVAKYSQIWKSPDVVDYVAEFIDKEFSIAKKWLIQYTEFKRSKSVVDYMDMEYYFLELLKNNKVIKEEIKNRYKYVFVDEFQDCNPLQVEIFEKLSELVTYSYWVGDAKQAIYAFRGTDTALTDTISQMLGDENNILTTSRRSYPKIVNVVNDFFTKVFVSNSNKDLKILDSEEKVKLDVWEKKQKESAETDKQLVDWHVNAKNNGDFFKSIAHRIAIMVNEEKVEAKDIAVLVRSNDNCDALAGLIQKEGITVDREGAFIKDRKETCLLSSILSLIVDKNDNLAKAQLLFLTKPGMKTEKIIDDRLLDKSNQWQENNELISKILKERNNLSKMSVASMVETIIVKFDLFSIVSSWENPVSRKANLEGLISLAHQYEDRCVLMTLGASVLGFLSYLDNSVSPSVGDYTGVFVNTYHAAKGLQWEHVILLLSDSDKDPAKNYFDARLILNCVPSKENLYPTKKICLIPYLFGSHQRKLPADIENNIISLPDYGDTKNDMIKESARLMYVGMTRAEKQLILTSMNTTRFANLQAISGVPIKVPTLVDTKVDILGTGKEDLYFDVEQLKVPLEDKQEQKEAPTTQDYFEKPVLLECPAEQQPDGTLKYLSPSTIAKTTAEVEMKFDFNNYMSVKGATDEQMSTVGDCIHNTFCTLVPHDDNNNIVKAQRVIDGYNMQNHLDAKTLSDRFNMFYDKLVELYGAPEKVYHELPFFYDNGNGSIVRGSMDYVFETAKGCVLVDFKTNPQGKKVLNKLTDRGKPNEHYTGNYNSQFTCYATALEKAGKKVIAKLVYYPVGGFIAELK